MGFFASLGKAGQIGLAQLPTVFIILAIVGVVASVALVINNDSRTDLTTNSAAYNASVAAEEGLTNTSNRMGLVGTVIGFAVVLTVIGLLKMRG